MRKLLPALAIAFFLLILLFSRSARFLTVNNPQHADLIVVLAGETDTRPAAGLEFLRRGYAPKLMLDVPAVAKVFDRQTSEIAKDYVSKLPEHGEILICPIIGLSTKAEAHDVAGCLESAEVRRILLVTSDFHTRRALSTFRHELPKYEFSVAAASDKSQFGNAWWKHRQWAKVNLDECLKTLWWYTIDRWR